MSIQDYMGSENVNDVNKMVCSKLNFYRDVIQKTYRHVIMILCYTMHHNNTPLWVVGWLIISLGYSFSFTPVYQFI